MSRDFFLIKEIGHKIHKLYVSGHSMEVIYLNHLICDILS